jgi:hypothetical protein
VSCPKRPYPGHGDDRNDKEKSADLAVASEVSACASNDVKYQQQDHDNEDDAEATRRAVAP